MARRTARGEASRRRLLAAAAAEFARQGYHAARVSDIVTAAGLTQAAFYLYFPSKEAVFSQLVADFRARFRELAGAGRKAAGLTRDALPALARANLEALFTFLAADPDLTRLALFQAPDAAEIKQQVAAMVAANLRANQAAGLHRPDLDVDVEVAAEALVGVVERLTARWLLTGERDPATLAAQAADLFLHGTLNRPLHGG